MKDRQFLLSIKKLPLTAERWNLEDQLSKFGKMKIFSFLLDQEKDNPLTVELEVNDENTYYKMLNHETHLIKISKNERRSFNIEKVSEKDKIKKNISDFSNCIFISYSPESVRIELILERFSKFGKVKRIYIAKFESETELTGVVIFENIDPIGKILEKSYVFLNRFMVKIHRSIPKEFFDFTQDEKNKNKKLEYRVNSFQDLKNYHPKRRFNRTMRFFQTLVQASMNGCSFASKELSKMKKFGTARLVIFKDLEDVCFSNGFYGAIRNSSFVDINHHNKNIRILKVAQAENKL